MLALPTGPKGSFLLGSFREVNGAKLETLSRYAREHGDVVAFRMGPMRAVLVSHPEDIERVLVSQAKSSHKGIIEQMIRPAAGNGIFLSENDFWKRQRRMVSPPFHRQRLAGYAEIMASAAQTVMQGFRAGDERDIYRDTSRVGMLIAAKVLFDVDVEAASGEELRVALTEMMACVERRIDSPVPVPDWFPSPTILRLRRAVQRLDRLVYEAIAQRRAAGTEREDLLSLLLAARDEDDGRGMTDRQLRDEAMNLFVAGFETTAINLAWTLRLLADHPEVDRAARAEIAEVLGERVPTAADLPKLVYLDGVINESLRLYPPAWAMDRMTTSELSLREHRIPEGWDVWLSPWVVHRDPRFWPEPLRFDPGRWTAEAATARPRYAFFPFGGGPRVCIGNAFAMMEAKIVLAAFLQRFRFSSVGPMPTPNPGFTLRPEPGVRLRIASVEPRG